MVYRVILILLIFCINLSAYQGEGIGKNRQEAIYGALSDIASQISITINSTTTVNKIITNDDYSRDIQNIIHIEIPKISFQNYHILEEKKEEKNYFVKLSIDKKVLAKVYARKLKWKLDDILRQLNASSSKLKKYSILKKANAQKLFLSLDFLYAIDMNYNISSLNKSIENLNKKKNSYIKELTFQVQSNNQEVVDITNSSLSKLGLIGSPNGNVLLKINLGKIEESRASSWYTGRVKATIEIVENQKSIFTKRVTISDSSILSKYYLKEGILMKLEKEIETILNERLK